MTIKVLNVICIVTLIVSINCNDNKQQSASKDKKYFAGISANDISLAEPRSGEWLYTHKEMGQSFEQYKNAKPIRAGSWKDVIYIVPIGYFNKLQTGILESVREYVEIYFQQETVLLERLSDNIIPSHAFRIRENDNFQLLASYVLDSMLSPILPSDGLAMMGISAKDLYPGNDWNYVFGLASYTRRIGVSSIYRLQNITLDTSNYKLCLKRLINVSSHEISHMLTLHHCIHAKCTMNGSNSIYETDLSPNRLCAECQQKLQWSCQYDNEKRLKELIAFFKKHQLEEDLQLAKKDFAVLQSIKKDK